MTGPGITLREAPARIGYRGLIDILIHSGPGTAVYTAQHPKTSAAALDMQAVELLASQVDVLMQLSTMLLRRWGAHPNNPQPYPLPWREPPGRRIGKGAIPVGDFMDWYYNS